MAYPHCLINCPKNCLYPKETFFKIHILKSKFKILIYIAVAYPTFGCINGWKKFTIQILNQSGYSGNTPQLSRKISLQYKSSWTCTNQ